MKTLIVVLSLLMVVSGLGCAALSHYVTPAEIDQGAVEYVVNSGTGHVEDYAGYPNLVKANALEKDVDVAHTIVQFRLQQHMEEDSLEYSIHKDVVANNVKMGLQREEMLFGQKGLLSLGLSMAGFGTLTGFVGLMRKRPGDVTQVEAEQAITQATGKTMEELTAKQKQFVQVVKGVREFMETYKNTTDNKEAVMIKELKTTCDKAQDASTQVAVVEAKKVV